MARAAGSRESGPELNELLRSLPSVEELAAQLAELPRAVAVSAARGAIEARRAELRARGFDAGGDDARGADCLLYTSPSPRD